MVLASSSYASCLLGNSITMPENCSEFLQMLNGKDDRPSAEYFMALEKGVDISNKDQKIPTYHLRIDGIPKGKHFKIATRNAMGQILVVFEGVHLGNGTIVRKDNKPGTCESLILGGFEQGEPSQILLLDSESKTTNAVFYLPYPNEPTIVDGLKVSMHYVCNKPTAYLFGMENLTPGEAVYITTKSDSDRRDSMFFASESGMATCLVAGNSDEQPNGVGFFEARRKDSKLTIRFPWREELKKLPSSLVIFTVDHSPTVKEIELASKIYLNSKPPR